MKRETVLKVKFEISQIETQLDETAPLLKLAHMQEPDKVETAALGLFLQSFYNGIENIMKFIMKEKYGKLPSSMKWHKELLDLCFIETDGQRAMFSEQLKIMLDDYLSFRHFIRNTYTFRIEWERMEHLILNVNENWRDIKKDIVSFIRDA